MRFDIGNFTVYTKKEFEELQETYLKPIFESQYSKKPDRYIEVYKTREFTVFDGLNLLEKKEHLIYK